MNILPNIYWIYNSSSSGGGGYPEFKIEIKKQMEYYKIKTLIELDDKLEKFWNKSKNYINEIRIQIEKDEYNKLIAGISVMFERITEETSLFGNQISSSSQNAIYLPLEFSIPIFLT